MENNIKTNVEEIKQDVKTTETPCSDEQVTAVNEVKVDVVVEPVITETKKVTVEDKVEEKKTKTKTETKSKTKTVKTKVEEKSEEKSEEKTKKKTEAKAKATTKEKEPKVKKETKKTETKKTEVKNTEIKRHIYCVYNNSRTILRKMTAESLIDAAKIFTEADVLKTTEEDWDCYVREFNEWEYDKPLAEAYFKIK